MSGIAYPVAEAKGYRKLTVSTTAVGFASGLAASPAAAVAAEGAAGNVDIGAQAGRHDDWGYVWVPGG